MLSYRTPTVAFTLTALVTSVATPVAWADIPQGFISPKHEIQLQNMTPAVKNFTIQTRGSVLVESQLNTVQQMVRDIIRTSKINVVQVPVSGEANVTSGSKVYENLEILIAMTRPEADGMPYKVDITLQEAGATATTEPAQAFDYDINNPMPFKQALQAYLVKNLNLTPLDGSALPEPTTPSTPAKTTPVAEKAMSSAPATPVVNQPSTTAVYTDTPPGTVSGKNEVQLQNVSPSVKSINIKTQGSVLVQEQLNTVSDMVRSTIHNSKLRVERAMVSGDMNVVSGAKVYENLEIVVAVERPESDGKPYKVGITLQEAGASGTPELFDYYPEKADVFKTSLEAYLMKNLDLRPR
ncbi:hypothetical protein BegalDRAFT_1714 [Beggiatoa alba B18LD]|uniref:Uncharacterized protein n=1 Tax=Beggiatoa alba B18LD TaxID=395493 RepID=I3CG49_9GAMM|nr:hypothetical protein [Beggiatoa alba]EIJ42592.1 hypothetical protein BegalDRAFT_1714 [Beggiatoa alba B18LD]